MHAHVDWRDVSSYPDPKKATITKGVWAWEFLRRNPKFRHDFEVNARRHLAIFKNPRIDVNKGVASRWNSIPKADRARIQGVFKKWGIAQTPAPHFLPLVSPPEQSCEIREGQYQVPTLFEDLLPSFFSDMADGKGVLCPPDLSLEKDERGVVAWVRIDFRQSIDGQLEGIRKVAKLVRLVLEIGGWRELPRRKPRASKFVEYLRILDAKEAQERSSEIARVLFPAIENRYPDYLGKKTVENTYNAARKLRDHDWRQILA